MCEAATHSRLGAAKQGVWGTGVSRGTRSKAPVEAEALLRNYSVSLNECHWLVLLCYATKNSDDNRSFEIS